MSPSTESTTLLAEPTVSAPIVSCDKVANPELPQPVTSVTKSTLPVNKLSWDIAGKEKDHAISINSHLILNNIFSLLKMQKYVISSIPTTRKWQRDKKLFK
jgi:hypothetical protein